jgi:LacI family transcriptional regulator
MHSLRPRVTQTEIARLAGVSQSVVASVLSGKPGRVRAGEETRRKILQLAQDLRYRPHRGAQLMKGGRSGLIGVISNIPGTSLGSQKIFHLSLALEAAGMKVHMQHLVFGSNTVEQLFAQALDAHVEGMIFLGLGRKYADRCHALAVESRLPFVFALSSGIPSVDADHTGGVRLLVRHALSIGHRRFVFQTSASPSASVQCRLEGFRQSQTEILASGGSFAVHCLEASPLHFDHYEGGRALAEKILAQPDDWPDVVMCHNDHTAAAFIAALGRAGLRVPEDLAVTGFDNEPLAAHVLVPITTVSQPLAEATNEAVARLLSVIRGEVAQDALTSSVHACELVVRESCGAPRTESDPFEFNLPQLSTPAN